MEVSEIPPFRLFTLLNIIRNLKNKHICGFCRCGGVCCYSIGNFIICKIIGAGSLQTCPCDSHGTLLEIDVSSHAACNAKSGSNSRGYRHDELKNQLPSILCIRCAHNRNFLSSLYFTKEIKSLRVFV